MRRRQLGRRGWEGFVAGSSLRNGFCPYCMWQVTCTEVRLSQSSSLSGISLLVCLAWVSGRLTAPRIHGSCALSTSTELVLNLNMPNALLLEMAVNLLSRTSCLPPFHWEMSLPWLSSELCPGPDMESASSGIKAMPRALGPVAEVLVPEASLVIGWLAVGWGHCVLFLVLHPARLMPRVPCPGALPEVETDVVLLYCFSCLYPFKSPVVCLLTTQNCGLSCWGVNVCAIVTAFEHGGGHNASQGKVTRNQVVLSSCGVTFSLLRSPSLQTSSQAPLISGFKLIYLSSSIGGLIIFTLQKSCILY